MPFLKLIAGTRLQLLLRAVCIVLFIAHVLGSVAAAHAQTAPQLRTRSAEVLANLADEKYVPGEVLVRFKPTSTHISRNALHSALKANVVRSFQSVENLQLVQIPTGASLRETVQHYRADSSVLYAEPNYRVKALGAPSDPLFPQQWHLNNTARLGGSVSGADIRALQAWQLTSGSKQVAVVTIDTGVDYTHPDLMANVSSTGLNVLTNTSDPMDDNGHGTHVAGIIGAVGNNGVGVSGVSWSVQIYSCKFLDQYGNGTVAGAVSCLEYAQQLRNSGVNVVATSNSWGGTDMSQALADAIQAQMQANILFIAAAGNDFSDNDVIPVYPANIGLPNMIVVAATTDSDRLALFSNTGRHTVHIAAPGQEILSTYPGASYATDTGTSMATPMVTGVAVLVAAANPSYQWMDIKNAILSGGDALPDLQNTITGNRLNAYGALSCTNAPLFRRLNPINLNNAGTTGTPITFSYLNINCHQPAGSATLQVQVSDGSMVELTDDGTGADLAAGDGIFTGSWTPQHTGSYTVTLPEGETATVQALLPYHAAQVQYDYRQITGTSLNLSDDSVTSITSPFPITFGGGSFSTIYVASDGTLSFTDPFESFYNTFLPTGVTDADPAWNSPTVTLLAPYWDDLYPVPNSTQNVYWAVTGTAPNRELVVEWRNVRFFDCHSDPSKTVTFQVVLSEADSSVLYQYQNLQSGCQLPYNNHDNGGSATIGLQIAPTVGYDWNMGPNASYPGLVPSNSAIRWQLASIPFPNSPVPAITSVSPNQVPISSDSTVTVTGTNFVPGSQVYFGLSLAGSSGQLLTNYVSSTQLTATLLTTNTFEQGQFMLTVVNPAPGGGTSNAVLTGVGVTPVIITSLSPASVKAGSPAFTLTINGSGFRSNSSVTWGNTLLSPISVSATALQLSVTAAMVATAGTVNISVFAPGPGASNMMNFTITSADASAVSYTPMKLLRPGDATSQPLRFLGWQYAAQAGEAYRKHFARPYAGPSVVNPAGANNVSTQSATIPAGAPLPGIALRPTLPAGFLPTSVAIGDFNGDGKADWAVSNGGDDTIWVFLGHGDGSWDLPHIINLRGHAPVALVTVDLRGTGIMDLLVAEADSGTLGVLLGRGDGTFQDEDEYFLPAPPTFLCLGDFTNSGHQGVVVGTLGALEQGAIYLLQGDGTGRLGKPVSLPSHKRYAGSTPSAIWMAAGDWDKDGLLDIATSEVWPPDGISESGVLSYLNRGDGSMKELSEVFDNFFMSTYGIASGDINEDGCLDLVVVLSGSALPYLGNCDGTFTMGSNQNIGLGDFSYGVKLADIDGDGHLDLIASGVYTGQGGSGYGTDSGALMTVALGKGNGWFNTPRVFRGESSAFMFDVGDINGDGKPEIIAANQDSDSVTIFFNKGNGDFGTPSGLYVGYMTDGQSGSWNTPSSLPIAAKITGSSNLDIGFLQSIRYATSPYMLTVVPGLGQSKFGAPVRTPLPANVNDYFQDMLLADFRNTGRSDALVAFTNMDSYAARLIYAPANSDGTFGTPQVISVGSYFGGALASGDLNKDGKLDFVYATIDPSGLHVIPYMGSGSGTFTAGSAASVSGTFMQWAGTANVVDVNRDGKPDVLVWITYNQVPYNNHQLYEFLGNGDGTFSPGKLVIQNIDNFRIADLNHDGLPDLVEFYSGSESYPASGVPEVRVYLGQADGSFTLTHRYTPYTDQPAYALIPSIAQPTPSSFLADYDGDGELDIALFQRVLYSQNDVYAQFLKGNGDGSFTPTNVTHRLQTSWAPVLAADFNGDGIADLLEFNGFSSSLDTIPGKLGPALQVAMRSQPIIGQQGTLRVTLNAAPGSDTPVALTASENTITIPASVVVPAGANYLDVPVQLGSSFDSTHVFSITATVAGQFAVTYGTKMPNGRSGVSLAVASNSASMVSGGLSSYTLYVTSLNGWSGTLTAICTGLPSGATCADVGVLTLAAGGNLVVTQTVNSTASLATGSYPFTWTVSDGTNQSSLTLSLLVGDFSLQLPQSVLSIMTTGFASMTVNVPSVQGYSGVVNLSCTGLPTNASCSPAFTDAGGSTQLWVSTQNTAPADYPFTIVGLSNNVTHLAPATLRVQGVTASLSPTSGTVKVGNSTTTVVTLSATNGFSEPVSLACTGPTGVLCTLSNNTVNLSGSGTQTIGATISVASNFSMQSAPQKSRLSSAGRYGWPAPFLLGGLLLALKRHKRLALNLLFLLVAMALVSCGGAGGSSSNPNPPPTPNSKTVTVNFTLGANSINPYTFASYTLTVTQ
jgi:subtilisin family serine protease